LRVTFKTRKTTLNYEFKHANTHAQFLLFPSVPIHLNIQCFIFFLPFFLSFFLFFLMAGLHVTGDLHVVVHDAVEDGQQAIKAKELGSEELLARTSLATGTTATPLACLAALGLPERGHEEAPRAEETERQVESLLLI
jgi:hypothetical protein